MPEFIRRTTLFSHLVVKPPNHRKSSVKRRRKITNKRQTTDQKLIRTSFLSRDVNSYHESLAPPAIVLETSSIIFLLSTSKHVFFSLLS
jgi:hypothetical protein